MPISIYIAIRFSTLTIQNCTPILTVNTSGTFSGISFPLTNNAILAQNNLSLSFVPANPLPQGSSYLRIISQVPITYNYTNTGTSNKPSQITTTDGSLLIGNLSANSINFGSPYTLGNFVVTNPPSIKTLTIIFITQNLTNSVYYNIDTQTITLTAVQSTILAYSIIITNLNAYKISPYLLYFTNINPLTINSFIVINFPT